MTLEEIGTLDSTTLYEGWVGGENELSKKGKGRDARSLMPV